MKRLNYTPHAIVVSGVTFPPCGKEARVSEDYSPIVNGYTTKTIGEVVVIDSETKEEEPFPDPVDGVEIIVSAMVFEATKRPDVIAPATGHPDVKRYPKGHKLQGMIKSVPCFLKREVKHRVVIVHLDDSTQSSLMTQEEINHAIKGEYVQDIIKVGK